MKINWGTGITIAIIGFISFIVFLVVRLSLTDTDLYAEDYYQQEIDYQDKITAIANIDQLDEDFNIKQDNKAIIISFPKDFSTYTITGTIHFYRADNASLDKKIIINTVNNRQVLLKKDLVHGQYSLRISCTVGDKAYFVEKPIQI